MSGEPYVARSVRQQLDALGLTDAVRIALRDKIAEMWSSGFDGYLGELISVAPVRLWLLEVVVVDGQNGRHWFRFLVDAEKRIVVLRSYKYRSSSGQLSNRPPPHA